MAIFTKHPWTYNYLQLPFHTGNRFMFLPFNMYPGHRGYGTVGGSQSILPANFLQQFMPVLNSLFGNVKRGSEPMKKISLHKIGTENADMPFYVPSSIPSTGLSIPSNLVPIVGSSGSPRPAPDPARIAAIFDAFKAKDTEEPVFGPSVRFSTIDPILYFFLKQRYSAAPPIVPSVAPSVVPSPYRTFPSPYRTFPSYDPMLYPVFPSHNPIPTPPSAGNKKQDSMSANRAPLYKAGGGDAGVPPDIKVINTPLGAIPVDPRIWLQPLSYHPVLSGAALGSLLGSLYLTSKHRGKYRSIKERIFSPETAYGIVVGGISGAALATALHNLIKLKNEQ